MQVPVATVYKAGRAVDVDLGDVAQWLADGWSREPSAPVVEPVAATVEAAPAQPQGRANRRGKV